MYLKRLGLLWSSRRLVCFRHRRATFEPSTDELGNRLGRAVAESSFHQFADYNWDPSLGCPSFVTEPAGVGRKASPRAGADIRRYVRNLALGLAPERRV